MGMITIACSNALHIPLADKSVQCVVTSPPYWGLRDYGTATWEGGSAECDHTVDRSAGVASSTLQGGKKTTNHQQESNGSHCPRCGARRIDAQIGLEATPAAYVAHIVAVMRECWRVLKDSGTLWLNLGDSYANNRGTGASPEMGDKQKSNIGSHLGKTVVPDGYKQKDLIGIPWRVAFALQDDGWYLRSDIIWHKPNPMPESVTDRPTKAHEYVFLLTKQSKYYYDAEAIKDPIQQVSIERAKYTFESSKRSRANSHIGDSSDYMIANQLVPESGMRNKRSVWTIATSPYSGAHFATFPPALIEPMILAGTSARGECPHCGKAWVRVVEVKSGDTEANQRPKKTAGMQSNTSTLSLSGNGSKEWAKRGSNSNTIGWRPQCACWEYAPDMPIIDGVGFKQPPEPIPQTVLDPFAGSGTTGAVAVKHGRKAVLLELNLKYIDLQGERSSGVQMVMPS
jgi:DNA modification methylase